jgi:hypothetical protein
MTASAAFPHLARFFRGYLHEDFVTEHGSAANALAAFRAELSPADRRALGAECEHLAEALRPMPIAAIRRLLVDEFHSAWNPATRVEVLTLLLS